MMRDHFRGYYPPTAEELDEVWTRGLLVVDTNVLLRLYRLGGSTRSAMFDALRLYRNRLWIPHQVGLEFHRNRGVSRAQATGAHGLADSAVKNAVADIEKALKALRTLDGTIDGSEKMAEITKLSGSLRGEIREAKKRMDKERGEKVDVVLEEVQSLFPPERVGPPFTTKNLTKHRRLGRERLIARQPPGFSDMGKPGDGALGDYFLWRQLMDYAEAEAQNVILVTEERKDDWRDPEGRFRPELMDEFHRETGNIIVICDSTDFLSEANKRAPRKERKPRLAMEQILEEMRSGNSLVEAYLSIAPLVAQENLRSVAAANVALAGQEYLDIHLLQGIESLALGRIAGLVPPLGVESLAAGFDLAAQARTWQIADILHPRTPGATETRETDVSDGA